jgi:hypothetical protein
MLHLQIRKTNCNGELSKNRLITIWSCVVHLKCEIARKRLILLDLCKGKNDNTFFLVGIRIDYKVYFVTVLQMDERTPSTSLVEGTVPLTLLHIW